MTLPICGTVTPSIVTSIVILIFGGLLLLPGHAAGQSLPPDSGVDEYTEGVPGPDGEKPSGGDASGPGGKSEGRSPGSLLTNDTLDRLEQAGADGEALASLSAQTAPSRSAGKEAAEASALGDSDRLAALADESDGSGLGGLSAAASESGGGMGFMLPALLIAFAALSVALALTQTRRSR